MLERAKVNNNIKNGEEPSTRWAIRRISTTCSHSGPPIRRRVRP